MSGDPAWHGGAAAAGTAGAKPAADRAGARLPDGLPAGEVEPLFLATLLETTPDHVYFKDRASRFVKVSTAMARHFGLGNGEDAIGKTDFDFFSVEHARQAFEDEQRIISTGEPLVDVEEKETWEDGRVGWVSTTKMPLRTASGEIVGTFGISRDITLEKAQRGEIARQNDLLDTFLDTIPEDIFFKDTESRFVRVSRALMERIGISRDAEILGKTDFDFFDSEHARRRRSEELEIMSTGRPSIAVEAREAWPDGSVHWVVTTRMPLHDADGTVIGTFGINRDITEQRRLESELRESQKMEAVGRLAAGIAHDFNNLLMAISGYADLLRQALGDDEELRGDTEEIIAACERASRLTAQLLTFGRGRGRGAEAETVDAGAVVTGMTEMLSRLLGEDVQIELEVASECTCVRIDPTGLEQVVLNLALNARDAMPSGGHLRVEVRCEGESVLLVISDSGQGFSPELKEHLFEPYFTTKERGHGTGLGLATVYAIVQQAGGAIEVESAPGQGARFRIRLPHARGPCAQPAAETEPAEEDVLPGHAGQTILVVEDESAVRMLVGQFLEEAGYAVLRAASAEEALAVAGDTIFELLLADVIMPGMSGVQLAEELKRRHPEIAVLLMSGYSDERLDPHGIGAHGWPLIEKPFRLGALLELIEAQLERTSSLELTRALAAGGDGRRTKSA